MLSIILIDTESQVLHKQRFSDTIPSFTSIKAIGNVVVTIRQDNEYSITFKGSKDAIKSVYSSIKFSNNCLFIDASRVLYSEKIYVDIIMPYVDTIKLYTTAIVYTPTNLWLDRLYIAQYSENSSTIYISSDNCKIEVVGDGVVMLSGIVDRLKIIAQQDVSLTCDFISKYLYVESNNRSLITLLGKSFLSDLHSNQKSRIDASKLISGKAIAIANDISQIDVKSEEKPLLLSIRKGRIRYYAQDAVSIDTLYPQNLKKIGE